MDLILKVSEELSNQGLDYYCRSYEVHTLEGKIAVPDFYVPKYRLLIDCIAKNDIYVIEDRDYVGLYDYVIVQSIKKLKMILDERSKKSLSTYVEIQMSKYTKR